MEGLFRASIFLVRIELLRLVHTIVLPRSSCKVATSATIHIAPIRSGARVVTLVIHVTTSSSGVWLSEATSYRTY
jgi:hypothetical protein